MSAQDTLVTQLLLEAAQARAEAKSFDQEIDKVGSKWQRLKIVIKKEINAVLGSINALIGVARSMITAFGLQLDPFQDYIFQLIAVTVTTLVNMALAYTVTIAGIPIGLAISAAAGVFALASTASAAAGMAEAKEAMNNASALMNSISALGISMTWAGGI
jgi:antitoxin component of RelBE/YafQ-DinJ toxin-antitoxin module